MRTLLESLLKSIHGVALCCAHFKWQRSLWPEKELEREAWVLPTSLLSSHLANHWVTWSWTKTVKCSQRPCCIVGNVCGRWRVSKASIQSENYLHFEAYWTDCESAVLNAYLSLTSDETDWFPSIHLFTQAVQWEFISRFNVGLPQHNA